MPPLARALLILLVLIASLSPAPAAVSPERATALRARFAEGCQLVEQNRLEPALEIFAEILREDPEARGSLLMSGLVENRRHRFPQAAEFFERFLRLEPNHEQGLIGAIKALHGTGRPADAEPYRLRLLHLRASGKSDRLRTMASYEREVIPQPAGRWISVQEYFEEGDLLPRWAWLLMKDERTIARRLTLNRLPETAAAEFRTTNPTLDPGPVFALSEALYEGGVLHRTKIHRIVSGSTPYTEVRTWALQILTRPPAP